MVDIGCSVDVSVPRRDSTVAATDAVDALRHRRFRYHRAVEIMGIDIRTIVSDNVAKRCAGCGEIIEGTPWRVNILDIVAPETAVSWTERPAINPGPFQFHGDPSHVRRWMAERDLAFCRKGEIREIMRPVLLPPPADAPDTVRYGLCDGIHRDDHEFIPA